MWTTQLFLRAHKHTQYIYTHVHAICVWNSDTCTVLSFYIYIWWNSYSTEEQKWENVVMWITHTHPYSYIYCILLLSIVHCSFCILPSFSILSLSVSGCSTTTFRYMAIAIITYGTVCVSCVPHSDGSDRIDEQWACVRGARAPWHHKHGRRNERTLNIHELWMDWLHVHGVHFIYTSLFIWIVYVCGARPQLCISHNT